jgi:hypothetical protein
VAEKVIVHPPCESIDETRFAEICLIFSNHPANPKAIELTCSRLITEREREMEIDDKIPMITTTMINSSRVNALNVFRLLLRGEQAKLDFFMDTKTTPLVAI